MENLIKFLQNLTLEGCNLQLSNLRRVFKNIQKGDQFDIEQFLEKYRGERLYVLGGVNEEVESRGGDEDIIKKNYIVFDFDIYEDSDMDEYDKGDVYALGGEIVNRLSDHPVWGKFSYVVFSGGGIHIYYLAEDTLAIENAVDIRNFKAGMDNYIENIAKVAELKPDGACNNPARIMRLPKSINSKREPEVQVDFLVANHNQTCQPLFDKILEWGAEIIEKRRKKRKQEVDTTASEVGVEADSVFSAIQKLPIGEIVAREMGWDFHGRNFKGPNEHGKITEKACFVPEDMNAVIHGGTDHFSNKYTGYSPFTFIKTIKQFDNEQTFRWFKNNYKEVKKISKRQQEEYKQRQQESNNKKGDSTNGQQKNEKNDNKKIDQLKEGVSPSNDYEESEIDLITAKDVRADLLDDFKRDPVDYTWGTKNLDNEMPIIDKGLFFILFGQAGSGKTLFSNFVARKNAKYFDNVVYCSLEMSSKQLMKRHILHREGIVKEQYKQRNFDPTIVNKHIKDFRDIKFITTESGNTFYLKNIVKFIKERQPDLMFIDNLDQIQYSRDVDELDREKKVTRALLGVTRSTGVPICLIHHANKPKTKSSTKKRFRGLRGLRGSQKIIDDCDFLVEIGRPTPKEIEEDPDLYNTTSLQVLKDRDFDSRGKVDIHLINGKFKDFKEKDEGDGLTNGL